MARFLQTVIGVFLVAAVLAGCGVRQVQIVETPKVETVCEIEQTEAVVFATSPEEAERQIVGTGWQLAGPAVRTVAWRQTWRAPIVRRICRLSAS